MWQLLILKLYVRYLPTIKFSQNKSEEVKVDRKLPESHYEGEESEEEDEVEKEDDEEEADGVQQTSPYQNIQVNEASQREDSHRNNKDLNILMDKNKTSSAQQASSSDVHDPKLEFSFVVKPKTAKNPTNEEILDQEIQDDLRKADELLEDSEVYSRLQKRPDSELITDIKIIENLPSLRHKIPSRCENIKEVLENLNSKHRELMNHFTPQKDKGSHHDSPNIFDNKVIVCLMNF